MLMICRNFLLYNLNTLLFQHESKNVSYIFFLFLHSYVQIYKLCILQSRKLAVIESNIYKQLIIDLFGTNLIILNAFLVSEKLKSICFSTLNNNILRLSIHQNIRSSWKVSTLCQIDQQGKSFSIEGI